MQQHNKARSSHFKSNINRTQFNLQASFYQAITYSNSSEYKISRAAQVKLQINPIYKLISLKKLASEGEAVHEKRKKVVYSRKREKTEQEDQISYFLKNIPQPLNNHKILKSPSREMNPAFRQKMKRHLKHNRTNSTEHVQEQPCFTGSSALLHVRQKVMHSVRQLNSGNRCQINRLLIPLLRQEPVQQSRSPYRYKKTAYLTERSNDFISPWQGEQQINYR